MNVVPTRYTRILCVFQKYVDILYLITRIDGGEFRKKVGGEGTEEGGSKEWRKKHVCEMSLIF
jgi:hypothetical protein